MFCSPCSTKGVPLEYSPPPLPPSRIYQPIQQQFVTPQSARCSAPPVPPRGVPLEYSPPLPPSRIYQPIQQQFVTSLSETPRMPIHNIYGPYPTEPSHQMVCSYNENHVDTTY